MYKSSQATVLTCLLALPAVGNTAQTCQPSIPATSPTAQFIDNSDGTVTDQNTGLMWKRCSEGQTWTGSACKGRAALNPWKAALGLAQTINKKGFAERNDWRLPNIKELSSIVEEQCTGPAINIKLFPGTSSEKFWSSSSDSANGKQTWYIDFTNGKSSSIVKDDRKPVRLVRDAQ